MRSLGSLLILPYLARDTLHRWLARPSSPLARLLVTYTLGFCGLVYLGSYAISAKALRERIHRGGAGLLVAAETCMGEDPVHAAGRWLLPKNKEEYALHVFHEAFVPVQVGTGFSTLVELPPDMATLLPPGSRRGLLALPERATDQRSPVEVVVDGFRLSASALPEGQAGLLRRLWPGGAVLMPAGSLPQVWQHGFIRKYALQPKTVDAEHVGRWERALRLLARLENRNMTVVGNASLLEELDHLERIQYRMRVWVALGISIIICVLLTSISALEFRQNRYVYALLGSFGVGRPLMLLSFMGENAALTGVGFLGALGTLQGALQYMTHTLYRSPGLDLGLQELDADIRTFLLSLGISILVSSLPLLAAICRPIGTVLK